jgi:RNA-directed DNA polymerase
MSYQLQRFIEEQARRTISKYQLLIYRHNRDLKKREKRTGKKAKKAMGTAIPRWKLEQQFNPFYVRAKSAPLSRAIEAAIQAGSYQPRPSLDVRAAKDGGGYRTISIYTVPDAAIGTWLQRRLHARNSTLLSESAFGYRSDRNANDAIHLIADAVAEAPRSFVVEYDFEKFFDSIDHTYLLSVLKKHFHVRPDEIGVLRALLTGKSAVGANYKKKIFTSRKTGIPQGNTISLFLANAVCYELDEALEELGVTFARYADDIVVIAKSYSKACNAADLILRWSARSKIRINQKKSDGISLLVANGAGEIKSKNSIIFLGCEISNAGVSVAKKRIDRLKRKIARVVYQHLIQAPKKKTFSKRRILSSVDWDLVTCVNDIRKIIYGRLSESELTDGLSQKNPQKQIRSHMSGFAMVNIPDRFRELDGWLVGLLERAYSMRASLVSKMSVMALPLSRKSIISGDWYQFKEFSQETRLPSTFRAWLYMRMMYRFRGVRASPPPIYGY